jgi:uncharacterized protein (DUF1697 family)
MTKPAISIYVAFLRGINVGGHHLVRMAELKRAFEDSKFRDVKTVLASGNVIFVSPKTAVPQLTKAIGSKLKLVTGHEVGVIVRSIEQIRSLAESEPFKKIDVTKDTRLYVTFRAGKTKSSLMIPWENKEKDFRILRVTDSEICSVVTLSPNRQSTDAMLILEKEFGRKITTRNWNTIQKILKAAGA